MRHQMKLYEKPFSRISSGKKVIEVRLYDNKRKGVQIGDEIEFSSLVNPQKKILVEVIGLSRFDSFKNLYGSFECGLFGHPKGTTLHDQLINIRKCYSEEQEREHGVVGIHIRLC